MTPKPTYLQGKALPFEEIKIEHDEKIEINFSPDKNTNASYALAALLKRLVEYNELKTFYTQEFKTDMITEYFKGWKQVKTGRTDIDFKYESIHNYIIFEKLRYWLGSTFKNYFETSFLIPQTLQQFISDCNRANIELWWKE
jgi:hypothetical protein